MVRVLSKVRQTISRGIAAMLLSCGGLLHAQPPVDEQPLRPLGAGYFDESVLTPEPVDGTALPVDPEPYCYPAPARHASPLVRLRGGMSYFNDPFQSRVGGEYGADALVPLYRQLAGYGGFSVNHFSEGTQAAGTVGLLKLPVFCSGHALDRFGYGLLFDQLTDTRFDDLDVGQIRVWLAHALSRRALAGLVYTETVIDDTFNREDVLLLVPGTPIASVAADGGQGIEAFLSQRFNHVTTTMAVGYWDRVDAMSISARVHVPLAENVSAIAYSTYIDDGHWAALVGLEWQFGGARCCPCAGAGAAESDAVALCDVSLPPRTPSATARENQDVVRGTKASIDTILLVMNLLAGTIDLSDLTPEEMDLLVDYLNLSISQQVDLIFAAAADEIPEGTEIDDIGETPESPGTPGGG